MGLGSWRIGPFKDILITIFPTDIQYIINNYVNCGANDDFIHPLLYAENYLTLHLPNNSYLMQLFQKTHLISSALKHTWYMLRSATGKDAYFGTGSESSPFLPGKDKGDF
jgi:hypothetical protein